MDSKNVKERSFLEVQNLAKINCTTTTVSSSKSKKEKNYLRLHNRNEKQGSCGESKKRTQSRLLQYHIRSAEEKREVTSNNRLVQTQQAYKNTNFSYGECPVNQSSSYTRPMGSVYRFKGRVLPYTHQDNFQEIPSVLFSEPNVAVQSTAVRSVGGAPNIYCNNVIRRKALPRTRHKDSPVFRRLASQGINKRGITKRHKHCVEIDRDIRSHSKSREKPAGTFTKDNILRLPVRFSPGHSTTHEGERSERCYESVDNPTEGIGVSTTVVISNRNSEQFSNSNTVREITSMPLGHSPPQSLSVERRQTSRDSQSDPIYPRDRHNLTVVDKTSSLEPIGTTSSVCSSTTPVYRCQLPGMGSPHGFKDSCRHLVSPRENSTHKCTGMSSCFPSSQNFSSSSRKQERVDRNRQHDHPCVHQQGRRNQVVSDVHGDKGPPVMVSREQCKDQSRTHQGIPKCNGRFTVKRPQDHKHRVECSSTSDQGHMENVVHPRCRSVCNPVQQQTAYICKPVSRPKGTCNGCHDHGLDWSQSVCLSSVCHSQEGNCEVGTVTDMRDDTHRTVLAKPKLVSCDQTIESGTTLPTSAVRSPAKAADTTGISQGSGNLKPSRMAVISDSLEDTGISKRVAEVIAAAIRPSTQALYNKRWTAFTNWCVKQNIVPLQSTVNNILEYLLHLKDSLKLVPGTILGHRTAIVTTLEQSGGGKFRDNILLKQFAKGIVSSTPPKSTLPPWDLSLVLNALRKAPFEPLGSCDLKYLTFKTVFLLTFASAARRSEVHAFSKDFTRSPNWSFIRLKTVDGFIAKNQIAQGFRKFTIHSLKDFVDPGDLEEEILLCPVRALKIYNARTIRPPDNLRLFLSFKKGHSSAIHPNTISSWLKNCIILCYQLSGKPVPTKVCGHSVRAMSVSWASLKNVGLHQILDSCFWKTPNTFISFYLKDLTEIEGNMNKLGKVSVSATLA